ncbi:hypothetical protein [Streptomyces sp. NPDC001635]
MPLGLVGQGTALLSDNHRDTGFNQQIAVVRTAAVLTRNRVADPP